MWKITEKRSKFLSLFFFLSLLLVNQTCDAADEDKEKDTVIEAAGNYFLKEDETKKLKCTESTDNNVVLYTFKDGNIDKTKKIDVKKDDFICTKDLGKAAVKHVPLAYTDGTTYFLSIQPFKCKAADNDFVNVYCESKNNTGQTGSSVRNFKASISILSLISILAILI